MRGTLLECPGTFSGEAMPITWKWYQCHTHQDFIEAIDVHRKKYGDPIRGLLNPATFNTMFPNAILVNFNGATLTPSVKFAIDVKALYLEVPDGKESVEPIPSRVPVRHGDTEEGVDDRRQSHRYGAREVTPKGLFYR